MKRFRAVWRNFFDIRAEEFPRTICMSLYFLSVLFAYYILKPASRALFLNKFDIDKLPYLYILIAAAGGTMAYFYTRTAVKASLEAAVNWSTGIIVVCLLGLWWLVGLGHAWVFYAFNIWVSLFPVVMVAQGWLVAANVFNSREARRLYGPIGIGAVVGAAFGGAFTAQMVRFTGTRNLILCSAFFVGVAWVWFRLVLMQKGVSLAGARAAETHEAEFSFGEIARALKAYRHLQVITAIMTLQFIVDVTIEYQFNVMAKQTFKGDHLTAFLGNFYGPYLSILTIGLQLFLTTAIVRRIGVGGTLQIMPATVTLTSLAIYVAPPSVYATGAVRLTEAATRYTLNRTGMELLYLPLPADLKNRTKAFIDVFVDRMARGVGGMLLIVLTSVFALKVRSIALVTLAIAASWIVLAMKASREYVATVRKRIASRRLDFESLRLNVGDRALTGLLERTSLGDNPRQATYALTLLAETPGYKLEPVLKKLVSSPSPEVRAKVHELARVHGIPALLEPAFQEISSGDGQSPSLKSAVEYVLAISPDAEALARDFVEHRNPLISGGAIEAIASHPEWAENVITPKWLAAAAADHDPQRRALAAGAVASIGDRGTELLHRLLEDSDPDVVAAGCRAAGTLRNRAYVFALLRRLSDVRLRAVAIDALAAYGPRICGTLGDILEDPSAAQAMRRQIPRVLRKIVDQRSVDTLVRALTQEDRSMREPVLKALNRLRESDDRLNYSEPFVSEQMMDEARYYFELAAALQPFRERKSDLPATSLLSRTLEERLNQTLSRMFRLLGLRYPPREIYSAYLAVHRQRSEEVSAALEFLDNVLSRDHKRIVLPLLDAPDRVAETGYRLFGIERRDAESAVRELMRSRDSWLAACAMATAAELKFSRLAGDIREAAGRAAAEVAQVARAAEAALA